MLICIVVVFLIAEAVAVIGQSSGLPHIVLFLIGMIPGLYIGQTILRRYQPASAPGAKKAT